jgi:uncharacterized membrane protein YccC
VSNPSFVQSLRHSLQLAPGPLAVWGAVRTVIAGGALMAAGVLFGDLDAMGVAYLGAACSAAFVRGDLYRTRFTSLLAQAAGAVIGLTVGSLDVGGIPMLVVIAATAGMASGVIGVISPSAPGFAMMLSIGVAFAQFGGSPLPWWSQCVWYVVGTGLIGVAALAPWVVNRQPNRVLTASVLDAAADLCAAAGHADAHDARRRLAGAFAAARAGPFDPRSELVGFAAATLYAEHQPAPPAAVAALRDSANDIRCGGSGHVQFTATSPSPGLRALSEALSLEVSIPVRTVTRLAQLASAVRQILSRAAVIAGLRIGVCMAVATAVTATVHEPTHAYWLPLTVAVIVRPEYGSVYVRTINRVCGTIAGAALAAAVIAVVPSGLAVACAAAAALAFGVLMAPKLYALNVIGVTAAALLAASVGGPDDVLPLLRLIDTLAGAVIAVVFGYLLWPGARRAAAPTQLRAAIDAADRYLTQAAAAPQQRTHLQADRDDAYHLAHQIRTVAETALSEPPPVNRHAARLLPAAIDLEDVVDTITAIAARVDDHRDATPQVQAARRTLNELRPLGAP